MEVKLYCPTSFRVTVIFMDAGERNYDLKLNGVLLLKRFMTLTVTE